MMTTLQTSTVSRSLVSNCRALVRLVQVLGLTMLSTSVVAQSNSAMPIADAHLHYSHDSVELTPPERVIEIMRGANLKLALVSSSDDNGTQLLSELAPDLIVPGLRPYRRRGELSTWFKDPEALAYVEKLLATNRYATLGEFHIYGDDAELDIPRRLVELADQYNLILHAHSDADAVERLLAQSPTVKVLWAHSGFDSPEQIAQMLTRHDRLWADLAFRSEVGSGGELTDDWIALFTNFPDRMMLGTDTFTPERIYYIPDHADNARAWLTSLAPELAERVAWKNAWDLLMPVWQANRDKSVAMTTAGSSSSALDVCAQGGATDVMQIDNGDGTIKIQPLSDIQVSQPFPVRVTVCSALAANTAVTLDASMPAHGHGMNYTPEHTVVESSASALSVDVEGVVLHMPGTWQWQVKLKQDGRTRTLTYDFEVE